MGREIDPEVYGRALLKSELMKETHDYLNRGRSFAGASDDNLRGEWVVAVRRWMVSRDQSHARQVDDLAAESLKAPYDEISAELKAEVRGGGSSEGGL